MTRTPFRLGISVTVTLIRWGADNVRVIATRTDNAEHPRKTGPIGQQEAAA